MHIHVHVDACTHTHIHLHTHAINRERDSDKYVYTIIAQTCAHTYVFVCVRARVCKYSSHSWCSKTFKKEMKLESKADL